MNDEQYQRKRNSPTSTGSVYRTAVTGVTVLVFLSACSDVTLLGAECCGLDVWQGFNSALKCATSTLSEPGSRSDDKTSSILSLLLCRDKHTADEDSSIPAAASRPGSVCTHRHDTTRHKNRCHTSLLRRTCQTALKSRCSMRNNSVFSRVTTCGSFNITLADFYLCK